MYKAAARQMHFKAQEGSSSVRITQRGYAGKSLNGDPIEILPTLKEQLDTITVRLNELPGLIDAAADFEIAESLRREMATKQVDFYSLRKIVHQGCMIAKERVFAQVAKRRLPTDLYEKILAEATEYWSAEYQEFMPEPNVQERRRASKKLQHKNWKYGKS